LTPSEKKKKNQTPKYSRLIENVMNIEEVGQGPEADQEGELYHSNRPQLRPPLTREMLIFLL
jgi:hypothetical protein